MADISDSEMKLVLGIVNTKYIEIDQIFTISINQQDVLTLTLCLKQMENVYTDKY